MRDKLGAILAILLFIFLFANVARYGFLAWFRGEQFPEGVKAMWPNWQRRLPFATPVLRWMDSSSYLTTARITTLFAFIVCILMLLVIARPIFVTLFTSPLK
jgi:uncharacterized integral membrane protein